MKQFWWSTEAWNYHILLITVLKWFKGFLCSYLKMWHSGALLYSQLQQQIFLNSLLPWFLSVHGSFPLQQQPMLMGIVTYHRADVIKTSLSINLCDCSIIQDSLGSLYRVIWRIYFKMGLQDCKKHLLWTTLCFYCYGVEQHVAKMLNQWFHMDKPTAVSLTRLE